MHQACRSATYRLTPPHYVDVAVEAQTTRAEWPLGYCGLFFATIARAPIYSGITFLGRDIALPPGEAQSWVYFNSVAAQPGKTAHPLGVTSPALPRPPQPLDAYYYADSSLRFEHPFFFAQVESMVYAVLFCPHDRAQVRFTVNPIAPAFGGPAWDFFWIIQHPTPGRRYRLPFRGIFKPFVSGADVLAEYTAFAGQH